MFHQNNNTKSHDRCKRLNNLQNSADITYCSGSDRRLQRHEQNHKFLTFHFGQRRVCVQNNLLYMILSLHVVLSCCRTCRTYLSDTQNGSVVQPILMHFQLFFFFVANINSVLLCQIPLHLPYARSTLRENKYILYLA